MQEIYFTSSQPSCRRLHFKDTQVRGDAGESGVQTRLVFTTFSSAQPELSILIRLVSGSVSLMSAPFNMWKSLLCVCGLVCVLPQGEAVAHWCCVATFLKVLMNYKEKRSGLGVMWSRGADQNRRERICFLLLYYCM